MKPNWPQGLPGNFGGLDDEFSSFDRSKIAVLPVPYDFSTSYQSGTRLGPRAMIEASRNMEVWDDELGAIYRAGIHTLPELEPTALGPSVMVERVEHAVSWIYEHGKLPAVFGGEHSITSGAIRAAKQVHSKLSVLQIDAHADMRDEYLDSPHSHACVMRRIREIVPASSVGIRSLSEEEAEHLKSHPAPIWSTRQFRALRGEWGPILDSLTDQVFITFDVDGLDPSVVPGTGTPEPGGLDWYEAVDLMASVAAQKRIVGFDIVELAPVSENVTSDFLCARLAYRMMGLALASAQR